MRRQSTTFVTFLNLNQVAEHDGPANALRSHAGCSNPADLPAASAPAPRVADLLTLGAS
jgi:hypothetical protein